MTESRPYMIGVNANAIIGTDKIIFNLHRLATTCSDIDYIVLFYDKPFTHTMDDLLETDFNKELWYDNYYFTYRYVNKKNIMEEKLYKKINNKYVKLYDHSDSGDFPFGDAGTTKVVLSNGDILFNNFGDVNSTLIYTCNAPKIKVYRKSEKIEAMCENFNDIEDDPRSSIQHDKNATDKLFRKIEKYSKEQKYSNNKMYTE